MAIPTLTFDGLDLNDGTIYKLMPGVVLGAKRKTWDDRRSYTGSPARYNVSTAYYIESHWPIAVQGTSFADLKSKVAAINTKIDLCTTASPKNLIFAGTTYQIVDSENVEVVVGQREINDFRALIDLALYRIP